MQNHAPVCAPEAPAVMGVDLPYTAAKAVRRFQQGKLTGSVTFHFKDGRVMQVEQTVAERL